jgi:hypothetical protein
MAKGLPVGSKLKVRASPSTSAMTLGMMSSETKIKSVDRMDNWLQIEFEGIYITVYRDTNICIYASCFTNKK